MHRGQEPLPIEAGFPFVNVLEPYGSTNIASDVAHILGHSIPSPIDVHNEALRRLPIMLRAGTAPGGGLSDDQVKLLKLGNVLKGRTPGLEAFGIAPTTVEAIVPTYLKRFRAIQQTKRLRLQMRNGS